MKCNKDMVNKQININININMELLSIMNITNTKYRIIRNTSKIVLSINNHN
jgi:hypothetical protein